MRKIIILSCLLFVIGALIGCVHYSMDSLINNENLIAVNRPDAVRVFISSYRFNDSRAFGRVKVEGDLTLWLKQALYSDVKNIVFVDNQQEGDILIEVKDLNLVSKVGIKPNTSLSLHINNEPVKLIARHPNELSIVDERVLSNNLKGVSHLLAYVLNISLNGNRFDVNKLPVEVKADIQTTNGLYNNLYDFRITER
ncbi:MAG: hypothetical protein K8I29_01825 [Alphaproteobacteria bacterium]|uniref:DUF1439 domain-containing protein n=1 Tax=Candidatus Nitrobium versatile TaxID=2884831 RepID=A0A953LVJ6_9BACT|nr:hypothetical protein [Candidatus Nitrobium versatile]